MNSLLYTLSKVSLVAAMVFGVTLFFVMFFILLSGESVNGKWMLFKSIIKRNISKTMEISCITLTAGLIIALVTILL